ncbi:hypothetical protein, partial [Paenibacillus xylanexedens]|uniref:hypothetical protein n=1 Tax=Paenibacillus xylanexedens TaxID=528191 RepID=UPI001C92ED16
MRDELVGEGRRKCRKGIVVIGGTAGEDEDKGEGGGRYELREDEGGMVKEVRNDFDETMVV